ncbi:MAG: alanine racemase [Planctomycetes bacterium]|nr:alanine racemase [Planctomycetota bacterium]
MPRMRIDELPTPCAVVDHERLERNAARMGERMTRLGVRLRPHVKTHKCAEIARLSVRGHFGGVTVSTLAEARGLAEAGFDDLTWAVPIALDRIDDALLLGRRVRSFALLVDHPDAARALSAKARGGEQRVPVFLKVDCGYHRAGVDPEDPASVAFARELASLPGLEFRGLLTHAGHAYHATRRDELAAFARAERDVPVRFAERLCAAGVRVDEVSVGSTPTMSVAEDLAGVTEARPGNYLFFDAFQASIGSCDLEDAAFWVVATVIGHARAQNALLVNAGALSLSKDPGATHVDARCGFGRVASANRSRAFPSLRVTALSQEHGQIGSETPIDFDALPIGAKLAIVPNHSCLSAALFDRYHVVRDGRVAEVWRALRGW